MENKKFLEDFVKSQNHMAKEEDKIKLIVSENEIVVDFGYRVFKQVNTRGITDKDYVMIWRFIIDTMVFEFKKNNTHEKV